MSSKIKKPDLNLPKISGNGKNAITPLGNIFSETGPVISESEALKLIHELRVHQIELEMQNKELLLTGEEYAYTARKYADLFNLAPSGHFKLSRKGEIIELNNIGADLLGKELSLLRKSRFGFFVNHSSLPAFNNFLEHVFNDGVKVTEEVTLASTFDFPRYVHLAGIASDNKEECLITVTDITERKLISDTQYFLLQSGYPGSGEDFFESLAKYLAQTLCMDYVCIDNLSGDGLSAQTVAVYNNGIFEDNLSYTLKETPCGAAVGKTICCFPQNVCDLFPDDAVLKVLNAESYIGVTLWSLDAKPIGLIAIIGKVPLYNQVLAEKVLQLVIKRAAGELEWRQNETRLKEVIKSKDHFFNIIAHDLRNRFTSILGSSELLYLNIARMRKENIKKIAILLNDSSKSGFSIIQNLMDWSRLQVGLLILSPAKMNLRTIINSIIENLQIPALNKEISLIYESQEDVYITTDEYMMNSVLRNLISNAIIFTQKGGKVVINVLQEPGNVNIFIKDNGIGIPPEKIEKLFSLDNEHSVQDSEYGQSAGLGLILSREFVEKLGGKIWVESIENLGSEFKLSIPLNE